VPDRVTAHRERTVLAFAGNDLVVWEIRRVSQESEDVYEVSRRLAYHLAVGGLVGPLHGFCPFALHGYPHPLSSTHPAHPS
jgi:hypothetical protein